MKHTTEPTTTIAAEGERGIRIDRIFDAPRERVWRAYTEPDLLAQWWGRGNETVIERLELERGGHWRFLVQGNDGTMQGFEGRFREVTPPERIVQTFEWDGMPGHVAIDTVELTDLGDGRTNVISTSRFFETQDRDGAMESGMEEGLRDSYAALDALLAGLV